MSLILSIRQLPFVSGRTKWSALWFFSVLSTFLFFLSLQAGIKQTLPDEGKQNNFSIQGYGAAPFPHLFPKLADSKKIGCYKDQNKKTLPYSIFFSYQDFSKILCANIEAALGQETMGTQVFKLQDCKEDCFLNWSLDLIPKKDVTKNRQNLETFCLTLYTYNIKKKLLSKILTDILLKANHQPKNCGLIQEVFVPENKKMHALINNIQKCYQLYCPEQKRVNCKKFDFDLRKDLFFFNVLLRYPTILSCNEKSVVGYSFFQKNLPHPEPEDFLKKLFPLGQNSESCVTESLSTKESEKMTFAQENWLSDRQKDQKHLQEQSHAAQAQNILFNARLKKQ